MGVIIRALEPPDYPRVAAVMNAASPGDDGRVDASELERYDRLRSPRFRFRRLVLLSRGNIVGTGSTSIPPHLYHPRKFALWLWIDPPHQRRGHGGALYRSLRSGLDSCDPICVRSGAREDDGASVRFLERRMFVEEERSWESHLDLDREPEPAATLDHARASGIEIRSFAELADDPDRVRKLYELHSSTEADQPMPEPYSASTLEEYVADTLAGPGFLADGIFIARQEGRWVGMTAFERQIADPGHLWTLFTGVAREYRRRGVASALKSRSIEWARAQGFARIRTNNSSRNRAMLAVNERFGFRRRPAWIWMVQHSGE